MHRSIIGFGAIVIVALACGQSVTPTSTPPTVPPISATTNPSELWYVTRGEAKSDQTWGVDTDSQGNIYTAGYYQSPPSSLFFDMVMYKFAPDGTELWRTQWGDKFQEKAFVVVVSEPYVYIGGLTHTAASLTEAEMAVLALDINTGTVLWTFEWGQGFGYEEADGLVVDGDFIYVSGWTTGETTGGDIGYLKLNRADGSLVWAETWGSNGFDSADGQMVVDDTNIYISGRYNANNMLLGGDAVIVKFDKESGEYVDHRLWGRSLMEDGLGMTSDGQSLYVIGLTTSHGNGGQVFVLKYDKELDLLWEQLWGGAGGESTRVAEVDEAGNLLIAANTYSYGAGRSDMALLQYGPDGTLHWSQSWGGPLDDTTQGLAIDGQFVYIVGSTENESQGMNDGLLIKADSNTGRFPLP